MTPENRPQAPITKEINPGIVPVKEGGERAHKDAPSVQEITDTGEIPTFLPEHSGQLVLTKEERSSDEFQEKTDAQRAYHEQRASKTTESHTGRNIAIGATSLLLVGGAVAGVATLNQPSNTPPETKPSATGAPIPGETQASTATNPVESPLASPTNLGPLETAKPTSGSTEVAKNTNEAKPVVDKLPADVVESGLFEGLSSEQKAEIKSLRNMTVEQFRQQPLEQQLVFARYVYDNNAPRTLHSMKEEGFDFEAYANRVVEPSETSTAQQVVDSAAIAIDVAGNLYNEKVEYDVDTARKMLVLSAEPSTALFDVYDKDLQTRATGLASSTTTEIRASKLYKTEDGTQMKVNLISHGDLVQGTYKLVQYKGIDGEPLKTWQMNFGVSQKSPQFDYTVK